MLAVGSVPYLNALPLLAGLDTSPDVSLRALVPSQLLPRLRAGELDVALVSAVELFRDPPLSWVPGPAITSHGPVESILLFLRTAPGDVRSVALDTSSLTAAVLARVCLAHFLGAGRPRVLAAPPDAPLASIDADAILRIGDPALRTLPGDRAVLDLGELWTERTGLPFVYALWLARPDLELARVLPPLLAARELGLATRDALADAFAAEHAMDAARCRRYVRERIGYVLGERELAGLRLYGELAHDLGLVDRPELPPPLGAGRAD